MVKHSIKVFFYKEHTLPVIRRVSSVAIFTASSDNFHPEGLFSEEIFGTLHTKERNESEGYIDLVRNFVNQELFYKITSAISQHKDIVRGKTYVKFNEKTGVFDLSNGEDGYTGYTYYVTHLSKLKIPSTGTASRKELINQFKIAKDSDRIFINRLSVIPAGLRDITIEKSGQIQKDEVNDIYIKILSNVNLLENMGMNISGKNIDNLLYTIQMGMQELHSFFDNLLNGKNKIRESYLVKKTVDYGTRNVIVAHSRKYSNINDVDITMNDSIIGLYQILKGTEPQYLYLFEKHFLSKVFDKTSPGRMRYIDPKTLKVIDIIDIDQKSYDVYNTDKGLTDLLSKVYKNDNFKKPVEVKPGKPIALVYDNEVEILVLTPDNVHEIINLSLDPKKIRPITFVEVFYLLTIHRDKYYGVLTRHPVAHEGNTYPTRFSVKPTFITRKVKILDLDIETKNYPILGKPIYNALAPHFSKVKNAGADFDGDVETSLILQTTESDKSVESLFNNVSFYVDMYGGIISSNNDDVIATIERTINYYDTEGVK